MSMEFLPLLCSSTRLLQIVNLAVEHLNASPRFVVLTRLMQWCRQEVKALLSHRLKVAIADPVLGQETDWCCQDLKALLSHRFKVAIADLVPGQETDMWVELEPSDHKKHIRNHSEFHQNLDEKPKASSSFQGEPRLRQRKRRNSDPTVVGMPADPDAQMNGHAFQQDGMDQNGMDQDGMDGDLQDEGRHQEAGRDAFRPMHARQSRYEADGHASHGD